MYIYFVFFSHPVASDDSIDLLTCHIGIESSGGEIANSTMGKPTSCSNEGDNWINFGKPSKLYAEHAFVVKVPGFSVPAEADYPHYVKAFDFGAGSAVVRYKRYSSLGMYITKYISYTSLVLS